jgi:hypothetical protein
MNLLPRQTHGVIERPVRRAIGAFSGVTAGQPQFQVALGIHQTYASQPALFAPLDPSKSLFAFPDQMYRQRPSCHVGSHEHVCRTLVDVEKSYG